MDRLYAQALVEAERENPRELGKIAQNFVAYLKAKGHEKLLPKIAKRFEEIMHEERSKNTVVVRVAQTGALSGKKQELLAEIEKEFGDAAVETIVDDNLVGGYVVEGRNARIDRSFKTALQGLYQKMITTHE